MALEEVAYFHLWCSHRPGCSVPKIVLGMWGPCQKSNIATCLQGMNIFTGLFTGPPQFFLSVVSEKGPVRLFYQNLPKGQGCSIRRHSASFSTVSRDSIFSLIHSNIAGARRLLGRKQEAVPP